MLKIMSIAALVVASVVALASPAGGTQPKVHLCHAAGLAGTDKYVHLHVSTNAVFKDNGGHFFENGTPQAGHEDDFLISDEDWAAGVTCNPVDPEDPDDPVDPEDPIDPEDPVDPEEPVDPEDPADPEPPVIIPPVVIEAPAPVPVAPKAAPVAAEATYNG